MTIKPEDILADEQDFTVVKGIKVRKGTIGAALANAKIMNSSTATTAEKLQAKAAFQELTPALIALELHKHLTWKNNELETIIQAMLK